MKPSFTSRQEELVWCTAFSAAVVAQCESFYARGTKVDDLEACSSGTLAEHAADIALAHFRTAKRNGAANWELPP